MVLLFVLITGFVSGVLIRAITGYSPSDLQFWVIAAPICVLLAWIRYIVEKRRLPPDS